MRRKFAHVFVLAALAPAYGTLAWAGDEDAPPARSAAVAQMTQDYAEVSAKIIKATLAGNQSYEKLEELCDGIGHRISGSENYRKAVAWAVESLKTDGQENVRAEEVMEPNWIRGNESVEMISPRREVMSMLGLGLSVGTPAEGITAEVLCVANEEEFETQRGHIKGKIVLFNNPMPPYDPIKGSHYGSTVRFRGKGPSMVAKEGGVACLVRSVTSKSLRSPHTGATRYEESVPKIPAAAISTEDADMIARLLVKGEKVRLTLKMEAEHRGMVPSANVVAELRGSELPDEYIVIGGHLDTWDVGQGAHDDGTGCVMAMEAVNVLRRLKLRPRRTIRVVLFASEENGIHGGKRYAKDHAAELENHIAAIESDGGGFAPIGFGLSCADKKKEKVAFAQMEAIMKFLEPLGLDKSGPGGGADISPMRSAGVVLMCPLVEGSKYFDYHHTHADTLDKVDPQELSRCVAAMAVMSYVIADMPARMGERAEPAKK